MDLHFITKCLAPCFRLRVSDHVVFQFSNICSSNQQLNSQAHSQIPERISRKFAALITYCILKAAVEFLDPRTVGDRDAILIVAADVVGGIFIVGGDTIDQL